MYYESRIPFFLRAIFFYRARGEMYHHRVASEVIVISLFLQQYLVMCVSIGMQARTLNLHISNRLLNTCTKNLIGGKYLKEKIITFKGLTNAWNRTDEELVAGIWEKKHAVSYLSVETVNKKSIEALIENTMN
jgi:hypothetical protein